MTRVVVTFPSASLRTNHAGLDLDASAARYRDLLGEVLTAALPACAVEVQVTADTPVLRVEVQTEDPELARGIERDVLDHAWVVRQMSDWAVIG